jgi:hypothetical protein
MTVIELPRSRKPGNEPRVAERKGIVAVGDGTLEPVIRSALGIVRESADLLYHIAGFGVALVSGPKISRSKRVIRPTHSATRKPANVIPFPQLDHQATGLDQAGMNHDCHQ